MPEKLDRCVADVKAEGKSEDSAYAICNASMKESESRIKAQVAKTMAERGMVKEHHNPLDIPFGDELPETVSIPGGLSDVSIGAKKKQQEALTVCKPCELDKKIRKQVLDTMI